MSHYPQSQSINVDGPGVKRVPRRRIAPNIESPLLTVVEAATYCHCSIEQIRRDIRAQSFPIVRHGRSIRIRRCDLDQWIESLIR